MSNYEDLVSSLDSVIALGYKAMAEKAGLLGSINDGELFLSSLDNYLQHLESWQEKHRDLLRQISEDLTDISESERQALREKLDTLKASHQSLTESAKGLMGDVDNELGELNKKAIVIKKYVDVLPQRVSVTPRKKG